MSAIIQRHCIAPPHRLSTPSTASPSGYVRVLGLVIDMLVICSKGLWVWGFVVGLLKFIELLRRGTAEGRDSAIKCLRTVVVPCALDAYLVRGQITETGFTVATVEDWPLVLAVVIVWPEMEQEDNVEDWPLALAFVIVWPEMEQEDNVLGLAENVARDAKKTRFVPSHIQLTVRNDEELSNLLGNVTIVNGGGSSKPSTNED
ncbi:hypothetical protein RHMOL_Rhmol08G0145800 [Rhododendron molle]|uniref:Uncharacterized protein n=1 Tax=Rhododendron molle TaxID=49168 RepID=A0ACC0MPP0_RHOML|nr:hypothetical protein RHMOL_Rhmol08G0145800 [Rhododendron molle]